MNIKSNVITLFVALLMFFLIKWLNDSTYIKEYTCNVEYNTNYINKSYRLYTITNLSLRLIDPPYIINSENVKSIDIKDITNIVISDSIDYELITQNYITNEFKIVTNKLSKKEYQVYKSAGDNNENNFKALNLYNNFDAPRINRNVISPAGIR